MFKLMQRCLIVISVWMFLPILPAFALTIDHLVVFGDSLSDTGNLYLASGYPPPPYFQGRFSNGLLYDEQLNTLLGLDPLLPSLVGGDNYAWGGARAIGDNPTPAGNIPGIMTQVNQYLGTLGGGSVDPNALHIFYIGNNDVADAIDQGFDATTAIPYFDLVIGQMVDALVLLRDAGVTDVLAPQVPDWSQAPEYWQNPTAHDLSILFNTRAVNAMSQIVGLNIISYDINQFFQDIKSDFGNVSQPCLSIDNCANPDDSIFFDTMHPTTRVHGLFAQSLAQAVPEPSTFWLWLIGFMIFIKIRLISKITPNFTGDQICRSVGRCGLGRGGIARARAAQGVLSQHISR